jgi:hypothetical protein
MDPSGSRQVHVTGCCEHGNEPPDSAEGRELLDHLSYWHFLRRFLLDGVSFHSIYKCDARGSS